MSEVCFPEPRDLCIDLVCICPGPQQIVGLFGTLLHTGALVGNLAHRALKEGYFAVKNTETTFKIGFREGNNKARSEHLTGIAVNILRFIPIVGTGFSIWRVSIGATIGASTQACAC